MTDEARDVHVSRSQGVVIGDYNTVFQSFADSTSPVASLIRKAQFRSLVEERTRDFVGREYVFKEIQRLLNDKAFPSGYIMIRGEPGIGKTAIAASVALSGGYVHHFNIAAENIRSARQFLENTCAQLILRYALAHPTVPRQASEDSGFLSQVLAEAAEQAGKDRQLPVVVVIDALDEAEDTGLAPSANRLYLPRALPPGVFFIITTREQADYRIQVDREAEILLRDDDPNNRRDAEQYIASFTARHSPAMHQRIRAWHLNDAGFATEVADLSEGNFMYLAHVLPDILHGRLSRETVGDIGSLPRGLKAYYQRHWRAMKDEAPARFSTAQRPVLCFLAISREPVTVAKLMEWTQLGPGEITEILAEWREFLNEDPDTRPPKYRIYHQSFAEYLDETENLPWYRNRTVETALSKIPGFLEDSPGQ